MKKQRIPFSVYNVLLCVLAAMVAVLLCLCVQEAEEKYYLKWDVSDDGISQLSDYTLSRLDSLRQSVRLILVHSPGAESSLRDLQLETLYKMASVCSFVQVEEIDPITQPQRLAALAGEATGISEGTVFVQNDEGTRIIRIDADSFLFSRRIEQEIYTIYCGEARLIGAIDQVCTEQPVAAWFLTGHGEVDESACASLVLQMRAMGMDVHSGTAGIIQPAAGDVILLIDPQSDLTQTEADCLKGFVDNGVHLLLACGADTPLDAMPELNQLCDLYGLGYRSGWVVENQAETERYVDRPELISPMLAGENSLMDELPGRLILPRACALAAPAVRPGVTVQNLLITSDRAILKQDILGDAYVVSTDDLSGCMTLAQLASSGDAQILLLSSADMMLDAAEVTGLSVMDASENLAFVTSCLASMTNRGDGATLDAGVKQIPAQLITFDSAKTQRQVSLILLTVVPGVILLCMAVVLLKRRRL